MRVVVLHRDDKMKENYPHDFEGRIDSKDTHHVIEALVEMGHEVLPVCTSVNSIFSLKKFKPDIIFNLCDDGLESNSLLEPHVPAMLEALGLQYTGNNYLPLGLCLNKELAKKILLQNGIQTPRYQLFVTGKEKLPELSFPLIVKPVHEDGSIGIKNDSVVENVIELKRKVENVLQEYNQPVLVEEFIDGREFSVSMIGNSHIEAFPAIEMTFEKMPVGMKKIYSYEAKWLQNSIYYQTTFNKYPADLDSETANRIRETAIKAFRALGCSGYARIEFRMRGKELFVIEVNPNPDLSNDAELAKSAKLAGISYPQLIDKILKIGLERTKKKEAINSEQIVCSLKRKARNRDCAKRTAIA